MPENDPIRIELIKHISSEILAREAFLDTLRSRMGFTILIGPFFIVGSMLIAMKPNTTIALPTEMWPWGALVVAVACYILLGEYGARIDRHETAQCDVLRGKLLSAVRGEPLEGISLDFPAHPHLAAYDQRLAYLWGFSLSLGAFLGMAGFFTSMVHSVPAPVSVATPGSIVAPPATKQ
jgi:hypothetical protein